jgi:hypothetical protein
MRPQHVHKRIKTKLPPILDIDDDGVPTFEVGSLGRRWSSDGDSAEGIQLGDWPTEFDD